MSEVPGPVVDVEIDDDTRSEESFEFVSSTSSASNGHGTRGLPELHCAVCLELLRDCVECPNCHDLFCRAHLVAVEDGKSGPLCRCPGEACAGAGDRAALHRMDSFLANIPIQRMVDSSCSSCKACNQEISWGNLPAHVCDLQEVDCEQASWGCSWQGRRFEVEAHREGCPGRVAEAESKLATLEAEKALLERKIRVKEEVCLGLESEAELLRARATKLSADFERKVSDQAAELKAESERADRAVAWGEELKATVDLLRQSIDNEMSNARHWKKESERLEANSFSIEEELSTQKEEVTRLREALLPQRVAEDIWAVRAARPAGHGGNKMPDTVACLRGYAVLPMSLVQQKVVVFWPRQGSWYSGMVTGYNKEKGEHHIEYDDGDVKDHKMSERAWGILG
ncbi:unnamed protein product [Discosporangium mesarthrocarpum]